MQSQKQLSSCGVSHTSSVSSQFTQQTRIKKTLQTFYNGRFETSLQFFWYTLAYTISTDNFDFMFKVGEHSTELNVVQYFISYICVGVPLYYMELFIGQYTQMSMMYLKYMVPFGHGLTYTALLIVFFYTIRYGIFFGDFCVYFLLAWQKYLPWMICHGLKRDKLWGNCYNHSSITCEGGQCENVRNYTTAYLYYVGTYLRITPNETEHLTFEVPAIHRAIGAITSWVVVFIFTACICPRWPKILLVLLAQFYILILLLNLGTISTVGGIAGVRNFFKGTWEKIESLTAWCRSISIVVKQLRLSHAVIILNASKLKSKISNPGILSVGFCAMSFLTSICCVVFFQSCIGMLVNIGNWTFNDVPVHIGMEHDRARLFVLIPQSLGYLALPQIWSLLYFTCAISIIISNMVTHIYILHSSLADVFPSGKKYQNYIILGYCFFSCVFTISIIGESNCRFIDYFMDSILTMLELVNISCLSILMFWIYGVRRLSDDICFTFGVQPTKFWKITWYLMPCITTLAVYYEHNFRVSKEKIVSTLTTDLLLFACACPIPIFVFVEIFVHMKQRNLTGLLRPTYMWGPSDPEERHRRFSFNPRKETTYSSKIMGCKHNCLLHSKVLKSLIEPEARCTEEYLRNVRGKKFSMKH